MRRREFLQSAAAAGAGMMLSSTLYAKEEASPPAAGKLVGMYVHQHWPYNHPYAARTWTYEDWLGYLDGLHRLGFNLVQIWPVLETMPDPLTAGDQANVEKIRRVIDAAHKEFGMKVWICLCPNVAAIDEHAGRVSFEQRHFFYSDTRVNPADPQAMDAMMARRERLLAPLAQADAVVIIDSDPGGYPNSTNEEFVDLLMRHRRLLDKLRPGGIELIYWMWVGWQAYGRWYATGDIAWGTEEESIELLAMLQQRNPEPWGLARGLERAEKLGLESKVISLNYGTIEAEPSFPITNYGGDAAYKSGQELGPRGVMCNAQTHCLQLPNTFAFARGAKGLPLGDNDYLQFADDLIVGRGALIFSAWQALGGSDSGPMRQAAAPLAALAKGKLEPGPLKGLLFGDPKRFLQDLSVMLQTRAAFLDFVNASEKNQPLLEPYAEFIRWADRWQSIHGYQCTWQWPGRNEALRKLQNPSLNAFLDKNNAFPPENDGKTPLDQIKIMFYQWETYTPRLLEAMKQALWDLGV